MPVALVTGAARPNSIAAGIVSRLIADGWDVATSDLHDVDYVYDLSSATGPDELIAAVTDERGPIGALILSHAHDVESGILDTTAASFDAHVAVNARASLLLIAACARQVPEGGARSSYSPAATRQETSRMGRRRARSTASSSLPPANSAPNGSRRTSSTRAPLPLAGWTTHFELP